jgi:hypothetical protein
MPRITKGQIAAATRELETIHELAAESHDGKHACYQFHAPAASRHIATLTTAGQPLPSWLIKDWRYFHAMGWQISSWQVSQPFVTKETNHV